MYYGFIVYSLRDTPAVLRHCFISGESEDDTVMNRQQVCANFTNGRGQRRSGHCKSYGGCEHPYLAADVRIRTVSTIPTSLLDTIRAAALVVPADKMPAAIAVLAALAAHES